MHVMRSILAITLGLSLTPEPGFTRTIALGVVVYSDGGLIGGSDASEGTTVYDGDQLSTAEDGGLRVNLRTARLQLASKSSVELHSLEKGAEAELSSGSLVFSTAAKTGLEVRANGAEIRPAADGPTIGHIRIVGPKELRILARRGDLEFSYRGESRLIREGSAYRVELVPANDSAAAEPNPQQNKWAGGAKPLFLFFAIGAATGAAVAGIVHVFRN